MVRMLARPGSDAGAARAFRGFPRGLGGRDRARRSAGASAELGTRRVRAPACGFWGLQRRLTGAWPARAPGNAERTSDARGRGSPGRTGCVRGVGNIGEGWGARGSEKQGMPGTRRDR